MRVWLLVGKLYICVCDLPSHVVKRGFAGGSAIARLMRVRVWLFVLV
jgi:hypothetical protein